MSRKIIILSSVLFALLLMSIGAYFIFQPTKTTINSKPDYTLIANQLVQEYSNDENAANQKYLDAVLIVKGEVVAISKGNNGILFISFIDSMYGITCAFDSSFSAQISQINIGDEITIKGKCDGKLTDVRLSKCSLETKI